MRSEEILKAEQSVGLSVRNLTVKSGGSPILNDISFDLPANSLMAIMGGSGSGKTTLLNVLSQRTNVTNKKLEFDGHVVYGIDSQINYAYMQQTDTFLPGLTIFETLKFQADLRLGIHVSEGEKIQLIESLLEVLDLTHRKNERIASFTHKTNLSGGEQRRVSVAIQLLSRPSLLFLDEPTTGLDTSSSLKLVEQLKKLTTLGLTIILSIHQPRPEICDFFDKICLLTKGGRLVYFGNINESQKYFGDIYGNPIEYIMDLSVKDTTTMAVEKATEAKIQTLVEDWKRYQTLTELKNTPTFEKNLALFKRHYPIPFWKEVMVLTKRSFILTYRDWMSLLALNGGSALLAVTCGWMFFKPYPDLAGIRSITSALYVMLEVLGFCPAFYELERLWYTDGKFFLREYSEGYASAPGFIISRRLAKILLEDGPMAVIFCIITYFMWGLRSGGMYLGVYVAVGLLIQLLGMVSSLLIFTSVKEFGIAALIYSALYQLQNSACGYFVNARTMPVYVRWTKYLAYFWYAFGAILANQFTDWEGACPFSDEELCVEFTGNHQLAVLGFPQNWIGEPIGILVAWFIGFQVMAFVFLYFRTFDIKFAKIRKNTIGGEDSNGDEVTLRPELSGSKSAISNDKVYEEESIVGLNIGIENICLAKKDFTILNNVSASFQASSLNVIMGPSGSGKTTLLNYLSDRVSKWSLKTTGNITLNDTLITPQQLKKVSRYVTQHDDSLQATLSVRETLYYQAKLRIPVEEHHLIPKLINQLIRSMGLSDCAETLIGSEYRKGISGGEKRRVSIAVQLLSRPKILFLDEPTSGLDSKTAVTILSLLDQVAEEYSTTIILTIHQPSSEMFFDFGSILLLAKGGKVVYDGPTTEIEGYMNSKGYIKEEDVNIADFLLDLISGGLDEDPEFVKSRAIHLVNEWSLRKQQPLLTNGEFDFKQYYHQRLSVAVALPTILIRQMISTFRDKEMILTRSAQTIILTIVHTLYFAPLKNTEEGIANRLGLIQEVLNLYYVGLICNVSVYPSQKNLFYQEYRDGIYGVTEFSIAYFINELPTEIVPSIFFAALIVFGVGLPRNAGMFFTMFASGFMSLNTGESLGIMVQSCFNHLGVATNILTNVVILAIFMGGTMSIYMPQFFKVINYINPMKYAVGINAVLGFKDQVFDCSIQECKLNTGSQVLKYYNLDVSYGGFFGGLVACFVCYRLFAVFLVWVRVRYFN